jgi:hypothetical protein
MTTYTAVGTITSAAGILLMGGVFLHHVLPDGLGPTLNRTFSTPPPPVIAPPKPDLKGVPGAQGPLYIAHFLGAGPTENFLSNLKKHLDKGSTGASGTASKGRKTATRQPPAPQLYAGRILFEPERTMQLRHAEVVMVRMDAGASPDLNAGIDPKKYTTDSVKIGRRMRVHLDGVPPDAFDIVPMSPPDEMQAVTNLSASTWMWNVTPKKHGAAALWLNIWALARVEGSDTLVPLFQKTETIQVHGIPLPEVNAGAIGEKVLDKIAEHAGDGIVLLGGVVLAALGGWIAKKKPKSAPAAARP